LAPDAYPVNLSFLRLASINRLWGIPIFGVLARLVLLIPHLVILALLAILSAFLLLFTWIPILFLGRFPGWGYRLIGGYLGWVARVNSYLWLLSGTYPPFSLSGREHPIRVRFDEGVRINRMWGIPLLGMLIRSVLLLPHYIVLTVVAVLAAFLLVVSWVPVIVLGRQADFVYEVLGGFWRWWLRVAAYLLLMVDRYPPFGFGEDDPALY
jgi:hypothetical protein